MQTILNKKLNYGILKNSISIDKDRLNFDYLAGMIYSDGSIRHEPSNQYYKITIAQDNINFLKEIKSFLNENKCSSSFNTKHKQVYIYGKEIVNYFYNYDFENSKNKLSFIAGMIDGDGSFSSHKSSSGTYWRFQFGCSKEREIKYFEKAINLTNIRYNKRINKEYLVIFEILRHNDIIKLIEKIKDYVIIKKEVLELIYPQLLEFEKKKWKTCKYCNEKFRHYYSNYPKKEYHCKKLECIRKYNNERARKLKIKRGLLNKGVDIIRIKELLGHNSLRATEIYLKCITLDLKALAHL